MLSSISEVSIFIIIATILILGLVGFTILILFLYQKKQVIFLKSVEELKLDHEKNLLQTQLEIQEQTFQNISREIHDNIGLSLTLAKLNLNILQLEDHQRSKDFILSSVNLISKAINDLSDISKSLNSESISQQGLLNALQLEIERIRKLNRYNVHLEITGNAIYFDAQKELILFRIAQEALNNIIKHAEAGKIDLEVRFDSEQIRLLIKDNGKGFCIVDTQKLIQTHMKAGLENMRIRSRLINGSIQIDSTPNIGTTVEVTAPY